MNIWSKTKKLWGPLWISLNRVVWSNIRVILLNRENRDTLFLRVSHEEFLYTTAFISAINEKIYKTLQKRQSWRKISKINSDIDPTGMILSTEAVYKPHHCLKMNEEFILLIFWWILLCPKKFERKEKPKRITYLRTKD